jgi:hypothetical protein
MFIPIQFLKSLPKKVNCLLKNKKFCFYKNKRDLSACNQIFNYNVTRESMYQKTLFLFIFMLMAIDIKPASSKEQYTKALYTKNGLKIITYSEGKGKKPDWNDLVKINYSIYLLDGNKIEQIDSTFQKNMPFLYKHGNGQIIEGLEEAIHNLKIGGKIRAIIPDNLGYVNFNLGPVPVDINNRKKLLKKNDIQFQEKDQLLLIDVELVDIIKKKLPVI